MVAAALDGALQLPTSTNIKTLPIKLSANVAADDNSNTIRGTLRNKGLLAEWSWQAQQGLSAALHFQSWMVPQPSDVATTPIIISGNGQFNWDDALHLRANLKQCQIADQSLALRFHVSSGSDLTQLTVHDAYAEQQGLKIHVAGRLDAATVDLYGEAAATGLKPLLQQFQLTGDGRFDGNWSLHGRWPNAQLRWELRHGAIDGLQAVTASGIMASGWVNRDGRQGSITLSADAVQYQEQQFSDLTVTAARRKQHVTISSTGRGPFKWTLNGEADQTPATGWRGKITRFELADSHPLLHLSNLAWQWQQGELRIENQAIKLLHQPLTLSFRGDQADGKLQLTLNRLLLNRFNPQLADMGVKLQQGKADATLLLHGPWKQPTLQLLAHSSPITLRLEHSEALPTLELGQGRVQLDYAAGALRWQASLGLPASGTLESSGNWPLQWQLYPYHLRGLPGERGNVTINMPDFSLLKPWLPDIDPLKGHGRLHGEASRAAQQPWMIEGDVKTKINSLGIAKLGLDLYGNSHSQWQLRAPRTMQDSWQFSSSTALTLFDDAGSLRLTLPVESFNSIAGMHGSSLVFTNFSLVQLAEQKMRISGMLSNKMVDSVMRIEGAIKANHLDIIIPPAHPKVTDDLQWQDQKSEATTTSEVSPALTGVELDVMVDVGDEAKISGKGMKLTVAGALHLHGSLNEPKLSGTLAVPSGSVQQGSMVAEVLPDSIVTFTGNMDQPVLDIRLGRKVGDVLAGVQITGTANAPRTTLFSEPVMSDVEVLSLLATGRPLASLGQGSAGDAMLLASLLFSNEGEGEGVVSKLQQQFTQGLGLDVLDVESDGKGGSRLVAGTTLGNSTRLRVEEGLSTQGSTAISIEHSLSSGITLFTRQILHTAPLFGLRYVKSWYGKKATKQAKEKQH